MTSSPPTTLQSRRMPRAQRQAQLLAAAARAFARSGYAATSMEDIATEAGITLPIVYRHFASKDELYRTVIESTALAIRDEITAAIPRDRVGGLFAASFLSVARRDPDGFRIVWRHALREHEFAHQAREIHERAAGIAADLLGPIVTDERLRPWAAETIVGFLVESVLSWLDTGSVERDGEFVVLTTRALVALAGTWGERPDILAAVLDIDPDPETTL